MCKRLFDIVVSLLGLLVLSPILVLALVLVWLQDLKNPFYIAPRARGPRATFNMIKLRSMVVNADKRGGASTSGSDRRITWVGKFIRKTKLDEVPQLWNVLIGEMSLVGPRPQVIRDVMNLYTAAEYQLFDARPGITDIASIVFSDEGEILRGSDNPDLKYNQVIRPWKSRLGILYTQNQNVWIDLQLIALTVFAIISKPLALRGVERLLQQLNADPLLITVATRKNPLLAYPPPGATEIETRF